MEWNKAKNLILILLAVINIILLILNVYKLKTNTVSTERIQNIMNICEKYDMEINCRLPEEVLPLTQLSIKKYDYDYVRLQQIFFGSIQDVKRTEDLTSSIFKKGEEKMTVENSRVIFTSPKKDYSLYISNINELLGNFEIERKSGDFIYYFQKYRDLPVFSNYICVDLSVQDKMTITLNYCTIQKSVGSRQNIIGADEAIYCAIDTISKDIQGKKEITLMEKGFYDSRTSLTQEGAIPPVYAIYVNDRIYYVNAYTGNCYK